MTKQQRLKLFDGACRHTAFVTRLLDDLVDVSSIESGGVTPSPESCDVAALLAQAVELAGVDVDVVVPSGLQLYADRGHVQRATVNLISNASKYGRPPVKVIARQEAGAVAIDVQDTGDGVPEELVARMYDKFVRGDGTAGVKQGAGLGLAIVAGLVKANGGEVTYERPAEGGSRFTCSWPTPGPPMPRMRTAPFHRARCRGRQNAAMNTPIAFPAHVAALPGGGRMPLLGFGTWQIKGPDATRATGAALRIGYRHLDTATMYGNEAEVGTAIADSGIERSELFITTKLPGNDADDPDRTLAESLRNLQTSYIDLWLIHWPTGNDAKVWQALCEARESGRVRDIGVSNYSLEQIDELSATGVTPAVNQIKWSPLLFDAAATDGHRERGVVLEGYSALRGRVASRPPRCTPSTVPSGERWK